MRDWESTASAVGFSIPEKYRSKQFPFLGRIANMPSKIKDKMFQSKQVGTRESKEINMEGRVQFDVMQARRDPHFRPPPTPIRVVTPVDDPAYGPSS